MSDDNGAEKSALANLNVIDIYVRKTWICLAHTGGPPAKFEVSCRDINVILEENPALIERYQTLLCFSFFDKVFTKVNIGGQEVNMESTDLTYNGSPQFFFPGRGKFYTIEELHGKDDTLSKTLIANMNLYGVKACFLDNLFNRHLITVNLERGDRILDESEIKDFGQKPGAQDIKLIPDDNSAGTDEANKEADKKHEQKILFPIIPDKNPVN